MTTPFLLPLVLIPIRPNWCISKGLSALGTQLASSKFPLLDRRRNTHSPSISASGILLPMQAIFMGKTQVSCPNPKAPLYAEAKQLGFRMLPSKTATHWSTHDSMQDLVDNIIAPYFEETRKVLQPPPTQSSVWKIDCWFVHKSTEFLSWMKKKTTMPSSSYLCRVAVRGFGNH